MDIQAELAEGLRRRGHFAQTCDFMEMKPNGIRFERVVMNHPFTKNQDSAHVEHALRFLKPGERIAAIMAGNTRRPIFDRLRSMKKFCI